MCRGTEAVKAEVLAIACCTVRTMADQSGAEKRRRLDIVIFLGQTKTIASIGQGELRIAAVDAASCEAGKVAKILFTLEAVGALATGPAKPGHSDPLTRAKASDAAAE